MGTGDAAGTVRQDVKLSGGADDTNANGDAPASPEGTFALCLAEPDSWAGGYARS